VPEKEKITIVSEEGDLLLRAVAKEDTELLRKWKNCNREYFFNKEVISSSQQEEWYKGYMKRPEDFIFIAEFDGDIMGCMGFRLLDNEIDIYNVILGQERFRGKGLMGRSLRMLCCYITDNYTNDVTLKVLAANTARKWYAKNGFIETGRQDDYIIMKLDINKFKHVKYNLINVPDNRNK